MRNLIKASLLLAALGTGFVTNDASARPRRPVVSAPELSAGAGGAALVVLLGAAAIFASRRQKRS
jgi:MYXO-CTERM domain-containing protein